MITKLLSKDASSRGLECPACSKRDGIDCNGPRDRNASYLCANCGEQWESAQYELSDREVAEVHAEWFGRD